MVGGEEMRATRAITLVLKMSDDTHVAKTMTTSRQKRILYDLHANRAEDIFIRLLLHLRLRRWRRSGRRIHRLGLERRHQSAAN